MNRFGLPLLVFAMLLGLLGVGLTLNPKLLPSPLLNQPSPTFAAPRLFAPENFRPEQMRGRAWLLNVWASWCAACQQEHPLLQRMFAADIIPIIGLNYKDTHTAARDWLKKFGNPYTQVAVDADGAVGLEYGVYGVPETYLIDAHGIIRFKHVGPLDAEVLQAELLPFIAALSAENSSP